MQSLGGDLLEIAEKDIGRRVAASQSDAEPTDQGREKREKPAGGGQSESQGRIGAAVPGGEPEGEHKRDREQRDTHAADRSAVQAEQARRTEPEAEARQKSGQQQGRARGRKSIEREDGVFSRG